jgi:hypothetical protein
MKAFEKKLSKFGLPLVRTDLDNGESVSVAVRATAFDSATLPSQEKLNNAGLKALSLKGLPERGAERSNLTAVLFNKPVDGGSLQLIEVGGVTLRKN